MLPHPSQFDLAAQAKRLWSASTAQPKPIILLAPPGRDTEQLRPIAQQLGIAYLRGDLGQTITPEQHSLLTDKEPRLVALFGIDRLSGGERSALVRLLGNGARSLPVIICPIAADKEEPIRQAFAQMRGSETVIRVGDPRRRAWRARWQGKGKNGRAVVTAQPDQKFDQMSAAKDG